MNKLPLVVILGSTGSGKTKLSLELAKKFGGEIIGADSMQIYKALDIITAKATEKERSVAPHHLINILEPHETFTVVEYRNRALKIINNLINSKKLPIVVGGTNYYIESLLWKILVDDPVEKFESESQLNELNELSSEELHCKLKIFDPDMARRLHPNNKRKILRALEVLYKKGRKLSDILKQQHSSGESSSCDGGLRFPNSLVLWLQCDQEILDKRLDSRVDAMIDQGLLNELIMFQQSFHQHRLNDERPDYTKGVFQSIGFKEFHSFLVLSEEERQSEMGQQKFKEGVEQLKTVTKRYARKQKKWIVNRFLGRADRKVPPIYGLDTSKVDKWDENVSQIAEEIVESYIFEYECIYKPLPKLNSSKSVSNSEEDTFTCEVCNRVFIGNYQWLIHLKSNRHKKQLESLNKKIKSR